MRRDPPPCHPIQCRFTALLLGGILCLWACRPPGPGNFGPGATWEELPHTFTMVVGQVEVDLGTQALDCSGGGAACGVVLRHESGAATMIPVQTSAGGWPSERHHSPFFIIRLPLGRYTLTTFESDDPRLATRGHRRVQVAKQVTLDRREVTYIGSLLISIPDNGRRPATVRVVDRSRRAREVACRVVPIDQVGFTTRLLH